jgi:hypothetical protein
VTSASEPIRDSPVRAQGAARGAIAMLIALAATSAFGYAYATVVTGLVAGIAFGLAIVTKGHAAVFRPVPILFRLPDHELAGTGPLE